ncbi:MAG: hypothetical protein L6R41_000370 [Letrouitia leprolyta]|nr:MAG: hypothetical protein L6R41_000370 [Letrouitia leprolyta]
MSVDDSLLLSFYSSNKYTFACATSDFPCKAATHFDLVSFLGVAQRGSIDFFDIQWDPRGIVGAGGSASISQHNLDLTSSLVFKRCTLSQGRIDGKSRFARFRALCCEVMILSIDFIREHRNIVTLEGICWEVDPRYEDPEVTPVLIFEKAAHGDLEKYICSQQQSSRVLDFQTRLRLARDILAAVEAIHLYGA